MSTASSCRAAQAALLFVATCFIHWQVTHAATSPVVPVAASSREKIPSVPASVLSKLAGKEPSIDTIRTLPTFTASGEALLPRTVKKSSLLAGLPSNPNIADLTDCLREPSPFRTVPGLEDYNKRIASGLVRVMGFNRTSLAFTYVCSGSLIHPGVVLTAAHCLYDQTGRKFLLNSQQGLAVYSRYNGLGDSSYNLAFAVDAFVFTSYINSVSLDETNQNADDVGIILLGTRFPATSFIFTWMKAKSTSELRTMIGYPAVTQNGADQIGDISTSATVRFGKTCRPDAAFLISSAFICEDMQGEAGHSGSPLYTLYSGRVMGVLSSGMNVGCGLFYNPVAEVYNVSILVTAARCTVTSRTVGTGINQVTTFSVRTCPTFTTG